MYPPKVIRIANKCKISAMWFTAYVDLYVALLWCDDLPAFSSDPTFCELMDGAGVRVIRRKIEVVLRTDCRRSDDRKHQHSPGQNSGTHHHRVFGLSVYVRTQSNTPHRRVSD